MKFTKDTIRNYKNGLLYFGGSIAQLFISFFTQPIFSKNLSAEDFGIISYYNAVEGTLNPLILLGLPQIFLMNYFKNDSQTNNRNMYNSLAIQSVFGFAFSVLALFGLWVAFEAFDVSVDLFPYIYPVLLLLYFNNYKSFYLLNLRVRKEGWLFFWISILPTVLSTLLGLLFVVQYQMGAQGRLLGTGLASVITGLISLWLLRHYLVLEFDMSFFRNHIKRMIVLTASAYAFVPIRNIDRLFLERLNNLSELGYYGIGARISTIVFTAGNALHNAFEPDFYEAVAKGDYKKLKKTILLFVVTLLVGIAFFVLISKPLLHFYTAGRYTRAYVYANYLVVGVFFMLVFGLINALITAKNRVKDLLAINIIGGIGAIIFHYVLIKAYGFMGGCYAKIATGLFLSLIAFLFFKYNRFGIKWTKE